MSDVFCNNCGHRNPGRSNFCSSCGHALSGSDDEPKTITFTPLEAAGEAEEEQTIALPELPQGMGILIVKRGPNAGSKFALDADVVKAGRHPDSDIFLDDVTVSRRHAEFARVENGYEVRDVGSLNGTYLNRERIDEAARIENGDEVQIGKFKLVFLAASDG